MASPFGITVRFNKVPAVQSALRAESLAALERSRDELVPLVKSYTHVITGRLRASTRGTVAVMRNDVATTAIQQDAPYAYFEETGTRYRPGHFRVTAAVAAYRSRYPAQIAAGVQKGTARGAG